MPSASDPRQQNRTRQPVPRPAQPGQRPAQPTRRSAQPAQRAAQQPAARPAQPAGGARFKQQAPAQRTQGQARQSRPHTHHAHGSHGVAPATRSSYNSHARRGAQKKSSPVPMIIGGVVAVLALVAIVFFVVPAVKGFFAGKCGCFYAENCRLTFFAKCGILNFEGIPETVGGRFLLPLLIGTDGR